jgi:phosphate transport system substrate-binding protein
MLSEKPSPSVPLAAGTIVGGGYRVLRPMAEGGMGTVYEVEQLATGARRALKAMHVQLATDDKLRARFVREARLAATIKSDHVATVLDAGVDDATSVPYLVMELLEGRTLSGELKRRGHFTWPESLEIMRQVCHALGAAHAAGIVHRDVKPANIFLCAPRTAGKAFVVKVLDFGIAKVVAEAREGVTAVIGTPSWMAPEQTEEAAVVGPAADVWAIGLLAFGLMVGRHYWPSANNKGTPTAAVMRELVLGEIVPASVRAVSYERGHRLPPGLDPWFARCIARDPAERFADATVAFDAFAEAMRPHVPDAQLSSASILVPSAAPPPLAPAARTDDPITLAEGLASRSRTRMTGAAPTNPPAPPRSVLPGIVAIASAAAVVAFAYVARDRGEPTIPALITAPAATPPAPPRATVIARIHGSNTVGAELVPALAEAFLRRRSGGQVARRATGDDESIVETVGDGPTEAIEIHAHGSATAFTDLAAGTCDLGMSSRRMKNEETEALGGLAPAASEHVLALDGLSIVVNPQNPVAKLTKAQIARAFTGDATKWSEVGGGDGPIHVLARDDKSGTFDSFKALALGGRPLVAGALRFEASDRLSDAVAADPLAIGFIGVAYVRSAKAVMVEEKGSEPLIASQTTISSEDYPLARRLYLYTTKSSPDVVRRFVDFALSDDGQAVVRASGFVDLRPACETPATKCARCTPVYKRATAGACRFNVSFRFENRQQLDTRGVRDLQRLSAALSKPEYAGKSLVLVGFSDGSGGPAASLTRSADATKAIAEQLRARGLRVGGTFSFGADMPIADDTTDAGRERNQRVELWLR